jgi:heme exporter protein D
MIEWLKMGGYGFFVWGSYGVFAIAIVIELVALGRKTKRARGFVRQVIDEETR